MSEPDISALLKLAHRIVVKQPGQIIVPAGERLREVFVVEKGWAIRYRILDDGGRQIVNFMLPGDCFDLQAIVGAQADHHVSALTQVTLRTVAAPHFLAAMQTNAQLATAFWWSAVQEESTLREHIVRIGRRTSRQRCAHLLMELHRRLTMAGVPVEEREVLPLTRDVMADTLGLSAVHVSRSIAYLRGRKLIDTTRGAIRIRDAAGLAEVGEFNARYLHVDDRRVLAPLSSDVESA
ncbi:MAG: Crp/Fnr family transcriptional regulator [Hyphomonadaceae bacterium]